MSGYETESLWKDELWRDTLNGRSMEKGCVFVVDLGRPQTEQTTQHADAHNTRGCTSKDSHVNRGSGLNKVFRVSRVPRGRKSGHLSPQGDQNYLFHVPCPSEDSTMKGRSTPLLGELV